MVCVTRRPSQLHQELYAQATQAKEYAPHRRRITRWQLPQNGGLIIFTPAALIAEGSRYHDWHTLSHRRIVLQALGAVGWIIGLVSNQDEIADGKATNSDYEYKLNLLETHLGVRLDARVCYHKPDAALPEYRDEGGCLRRLPQPAMLLELMSAHPDETRRGVLLVGDAKDEQAVRAAGIDFLLADEFFNSFNQ